MPQKIILGSEMRIREKLLSEGMKDALRLITAICLCLAQVALGAPKSFTRHDFHPDFIFGAASSAYQVEGAAFEDGRKPSIFDTFAHSGRLPGNGDVTSDQYHKYKEDVQLMVETGLDAYRFSISWSRLIPNGRGPINPKGLEYYNNLINELIINGIQPHVTLFHSDTPQVLEDVYGGFISPKIIEDFVAYADVCFGEFGDRVLYWTTFNEANIFSFGGYDAGNSPPHRCSYPFGNNCTVGNSTTEPYLAAHHILLSHASAVKLYREKYQGKQLGTIGFNLYAFNFIPLTDTPKDVKAAKQSFDYFIGWFMTPLMQGDYPAVMKKNAGTRLPVFTKEESHLLKGSIDFIGLNYYTVMQARDNSASLTEEPRDFTADMATTWIPLSDRQIFEGDPLPNTPWGLQQVLERFEQIYGNVPIFIHENGDTSEHNASLNDQLRMEYLQGHIKAVHDLLRNGSNVKGYFVWSFLDMYELLFGYKYTFGIYYVNFTDPELTRYPKLSQKWYSSFLKAENHVMNENLDQAKRIITTTLLMSSSRDDDLRGYLSS